MKTLVDYNLRQKVLLLFLGAKREVLDPIRIMKGLFLIKMETPKQWLPNEGRYDFVPYDYGPFSSEIYNDLNKLIIYGYVESSEMPGQSWSYYSLTVKGFELLPTLTKDLEPALIRYINNVREFVSRLSFRRLLRVIYHHYPGYAVRSVFKS